MIIVDRKTECPNDCGLPYSRTFGHLDAGYGVTQLELDCLALLEKRAADAR